jgi:hypothetical protein
VIREPIIQSAYVTRDFDQSLDFWISVMGAGPFYVGQFEPIDQVYRGRPANALVTVAMGYSGDHQIEVIRQDNDSPSAYNETTGPGVRIPKAGLFHHVMVKHAGYDAAYSRFLGNGAKKCFDAVVPDVGRYCYLDAQETLGCFIELLEECPAVDAAFAKMREAHRDWDGRDPIRAYAELFV